MFHSPTLPTRKIGEAAVVRAVTGDTTEGPGALVVIEAMGEAIEADTAVAIPVRKVAAALARAGASAHQVGLVHQADSAGAEKVSVADHFRQGCPRKWGPASEVHRGVLQPLLPLRLQQQKLS